MHEATQWQSAWRTNVRHREFRRERDRQHRPFENFCEIRFARNCVTVMHLHCQLQRRPPVRAASSRNLASVLSLSQFRLTPTSTTSALTGHGTTPYFGKEANPEFSPRQSNCPSSLKKEKFPSLNSHACATPHAFRPIHSPRASLGMRPLKNEWIVLKDRNYRSLVP